MCRPDVACAGAGQPDRCRKAGCAAESRSADRCGIEAEDFGGSTVVVRAVPADVAVDDVEDMLVELAAKLADGGRDALREKTEWVLHSIACRAAIKAGDRTNAARCWRWPSTSWTERSRRSAPMGGPVC
mgnify:CR=1 FL=1